MSDEPTLVQQAKAGDFAAFEALVSRHERRLYALALGIVQQPADAQDIVQQTFLKAMDRLATLADARAFGAWLRRIATNAALHLLRERRTRPTISLDAAQEPADDGTVRTPEFIAEWGKSPAELLQRRERQRALATALAAIPENYRLVFIMRDVNELSVRETARLLGISEVNVKVRLLRARLALREQLTRAFGDPRRTARHTHAHADGHAVSARQLAAAYAADAGRGGRKKA